MVTITLPRLIGTREAAHRLIDDSRVDDSLRGSTVSIVARNLSTATMSFTDELLSALEEGGASDIVVIRPPADFHEQVDSVVRERGFTNVRIADSVAA